MNASDVLWVEVDEDGRLVVPAEVVEAYGLGPGARARIELEKNNLRLHRPVTHLAKIYVEPTNRCKKSIMCWMCCFESLFVSIFISIVNASDATARLPLGSSRASGTLLPTQ